MLIFTFLDTSGASLGHKKSCANCKMKDLRKLLSSHNHAVHVNKKDYNPLCLLSSEKVTNLATTQQKKLTHRYKSLRWLDQACAAYLS